MIEQYLHEGAVFEWTKPPDVPTNNDGTMVVSANLAPPPLLYIGMAGPNLYALPLGMAPPHTPAGNVQVPYVWVNYALGRTAHVPATVDVLTGFMSGCEIVTWIGAGGRNVGHLGTIEGQAAVNTLVKDTFWNTLCPAPAVNQTILGFNPAAHYNAATGIQAANRLRERGNATYQGGAVLALVTGGNQFYSIGLMSADAVLLGQRKRVYIVVSRTRVAGTRIANRAVLGP